MARGTLEVLLVNAEDLSDNDVFCKMNPYCIVKCRNEEKRSSTASNLLEDIVAGGGTEPVWNEAFIFDISEGDYDVNIRIIDQDKFSSDDFVGEVNIPLEAVFENGIIPPSQYRVVLMDKTYSGQIKVALKFTPKAVDVSHLYRL
ncbi:elicitor-responsive protein 3-like [Cryptomeria japonica]|uniref:elicitor-responsive protein 3-like n=1 Tax=Cryptomeria japonica TaxID=3369 RepID=UPI0025AD7318|nr:elicitor-responsive protein 3-like [Cryptomeria japonica]